MPSTDYPSLLQAYGANNPYGPYGYPDGLPNMAYGPPGGGLMGMRGATPGGPSMGFPAMGRAGQQAQPNPLWLRALNAINPISSAQADVLHPNLNHPDLANPIGLPPQPPAPSQPLPPSAANSLPLAYGAPTLDDYQKWLLSQGIDPSQPAASPGPANGPSYLPQARGRAAPDFPADPANAPAPPKAVVHANAPKGNPAATPRPAKIKGPLSNDPWLIERINAGPVAQPRRGYQTALDLSGLFNRKS